MTTENLGEAGGAGRREGATNANGSTVNGHARPPSQKERLSRISVPGRPDLVAYKIPPPPAGFPKLNEHALAGIVGDAVRASCDATDVHPAGVVGAVLSLVSAALGRSHYITFNARHYGQTFVALVGDSALGRKGESSTGPDLIYQATEERLMGMHASKPFPLGHSLKRDLQPSSGEGRTERKEEGRRPRPRCRRQACSAVLPRAGVVLRCRKAWR
jgi:hypothetical protein